MNLRPAGERSKQAVRWISDRLLENPDQPVMSFVHQAIARFDLTPKEAQQLIHFYRSANEGDRG